MICKQISCSCQRPSVRKSNVCDAVALAPPYRAVSSLFHVVWSDRRSTMPINAETRARVRPYYSDLPKEIWSGRRDSNPRPQPWQGCALPLSYARIRRRNIAERYCRGAMHIITGGGSRKTCAASALRRIVAAMTLPLTRQQLFARLDELGIAHRTYTHPPVFTVEEAKALRGRLPGGHCKSLFLKDKKAGLWLVVALEECRVDLKRSADALAAPRFSFG